MFSPTLVTYHAFFEGTNYYGTLEFLSKMEGSALGPNKEILKVEEICIHLFSSLTCFIPTRLSEA